VARLLLIIAVVVVIYLLVRSYRKNPSLDAEESDDAVTEDMVRCAHCGVHLPKTESVLSGEECFCSKDHRDEYHQ